MTRATGRGDTDLDSHFAFGKNWEQLVPQLDAERLDAAVRDIREFMGRDLTGLSFLDIGCGSGLSSLAAYRLHAHSILSVDIDPQNVENTTELRSRFKVDRDYSWAVRTASIVNDGDVATLPRSDVVYAWGVLHHTGALWTAIANSARLVNPNGYLYLMLYRDAWSAPFWTQVKRMYTRGGKFTQFVLRNGFASVLFAGMLAKGKNPLRSIRDYGKKSRGMSWYLDVTDWVGGYPFEVSSAESVIAFLSAREFALEKIAPPISPKPVGLRGTGSYQYLFRYHSS